VGATDQEIAQAQLTDEGCYRILTELGYTFDYVDFTEEIAGYDFVILPDYLTLNDDAERKIRVYMASGGKVIASGAAPLRDGCFIFKQFGLTSRGAAEFCPRYMRIGAHFPSIEPMDYAVYPQSQDVITTGAQVLAYAVNPYFNRAYNHFCSHQQTPPDGVQTDSAAIALNGNCAYIAAPIFSEYANCRMMVLRQIIKELLAKLAIRPMVEAQLPSFNEVTVRKLADTYVIHILNYIIERKGHMLDTIEEMVPLHNRPVRVTLDAKPKSVRRWADDTELPFEWDGERVRFVVPEILGHEMILIE